MTNSKAPSPLRTVDYEAIESALLESARGRWFLAEYSSRNRSADTRMLLDAITRLESSVLQGGTTEAQESEEPFRKNIIEMAEAISRTRREICAMSQDQQEDSRFSTATEELDAIIESTEKATSDILQAAEEVQELAWIMREKEVEIEVCDKLDTLATDVYTACSFQDLTGQRTSKVIETLRFLEQRVSSMIEIWGLDNIEVRQIQPEDDRPDSHLLNGPALQGKGLEQGDVDQMLVKSAEISAEEAAPEPAPPSAQLPGPEAEAQLSAPQPQANAESLPGEVAAENFSPPAELKLDELDADQKEALFS